MKGTVFMRKPQSENQTAKLLSRAKSGEEEAFSALLEQYTPLMETLAGRFAEGFSEQDRQDLRQEAAIAFCRALEKYDEAGEVSFGHFAKVCMENRLTSWVRKQRKELHNAVDALPDETADHAQDPARYILEKEDYLALCAKIRDFLSAYEYKIWTLFISGHTAAEIAGTLGCEKKSVENAIFRVRRKLRASLQTR